MSTLRKEKAAPKSGSPPPEAFDYDDDVTPDAVKTLADRARVILEKDEYVVIDGDAGNHK